MTYRPYLQYSCCETGEYDCLFLHLGLDLPYDDEWEDQERSFGDDVERSEGVPEGRLRASQNTHRETLEDLMSGGHVRGRCIDCRSPSRYWGHGIETQRRTRMRGTRSERRLRFLAPFEHGV